MSSGSEIICRPTKWFVWRALLMLVMFGGFGAYFLFDWKIGYPKNNYLVANYLAFDAAGKAWAKEENLREPETWKKYVASQTIPFAEDRSLYPANTNFEEKWPEILFKLGESNTTELWKEYSKEKGWPQQVDPDEDAKSKRKINEQIWAAAACFVFTALTSFFLIRTKGRVMKVDDEGYYPPGGSLIPFSDMTRLDKRKWETKGLATLTYRSGGEEKKAKIDGMVYGQFKEEEGAPAEALFQKVLANFEGELVELVADDEDEDEEGPEMDDEAGETSAKENADS
jgi:hypothetical protein